MSTTFSSSIHRSVLGEMLSDKKRPELGDEIAKSYNLLTISSFMTLSFIII